MKRIRTILVPTDLSKPATAALNYAMDLAKALNCRIHVLHVLVTLPYIYDMWGTERAALRLADVLAQSQAQAAARVQRLVPKSGRLAKRTKTAVVSGLAVEEILNYIGANKIDLVVMGTHGRGMVEHFLLGSVAERVVRRSSVPVLTVHGPAARTHRRARRRR